MSNFTSAYLRVQGRTAGDIYRHLTTFAWRCKQAGLDMCAALPRGRTEMVALRGVLVIGRRGVADRGVCPSSRLGGRTVRVRGMAGEDAVRLTRQILL